MLLTLTIDHLFDRGFPRAHREPVCAGAFDRDDGWFDLIGMFSLAMEDELKQHPDPDFAVVQVKKKFGAGSAITSMTVMSA